MISIFVIQLFSMKSSLWFCTKNYIVFNRLPVVRSYIRGNVPDLNLDNIKTRGLQSAVTNYYNSLLYDVLKEV